MERFTELLKNLKWRGIVLIVLVLSILATILYILLNRPADEKQSSSYVEVTTKETTELTSTTTSTSATTTTATVEEQGVNPFTGITLTEEGKAVLAERRPLLVSYDNLNDAWPQSGIGSADFYIEILAEGRITRFLALYYSNPPEIIGPIRSARPYIVMKAEEHDAYLAHVGGSQQALADIVNYGIADLDGLWSGAFQRIPPKVAPHNTYARYEDLMNEARNQGYRMSTSPDFYGFGDVDEKHFAENVGTIQFFYRDSNVYGDSGYYVEYFYDEDLMEYARYVNGAPCTDEIDGKTVSVSNVLVQYAAHEVLDDEGRLAIDLLSGGEGLLFRDGRMSKITWVKEGRAALTRFYHEDGTEILLHPGKSVLHVVYPGILKYSE